MPRQVAFCSRKCSLFDVYRGEPIPAGKKSLAYALTFQAPDKTLRDAIVAKQVKRIVKRLQQEAGCRTARLSGAGLFRPSLVRDTRDVYHRGQHLFGSRLP